MAGVNSTERDNIVESVNNTKEITAIVKLIITMTEHNRASRSRSQSGSRHLRFFTLPILNDPPLPKSTEHVTDQFFTI
jgi:hypothetical protein